MSILLLPLALLLATSGAPAAGDMHHGDMMDCPMHEGTGTEADRAHGMDAMFAKLDADGNGSIDRAEFARHYEAMRCGHGMDAMPGHSDHDEQSGHEH